MEKFHIRTPIYPLVSIIFSLLFLMAGLLISSKKEFIIFLIAFIILLLLFGYGVPLLKCMLIIIPLSLITAFLFYLFHREIFSSFQTGGRLFLLGLCAVPLIAMPPVNLTRSMETIRCPRGVTLGMLVAIRFIPVIFSEMKQINEAMKTRGVRTTLNPIIAYRAFLIPLIMRVINISEILSLSLETRAFDLHEKNVSVYRPVRFTFRDVLFLLCASPIVAYALYVRFI